MKKITIKQIRRDEHNEALLERTKIRLKLCEKKLLASNAKKN
jgi:hypothetical protein